MRVKTLLLSALTACFLLSGSLAVAQAPQDEPREGRRPGARPEARGERGPGRFEGGGPMFRPGQVLPPGMVQRLALTPEQIEKLEALQKEVGERLDAILTEGQRTQMREMAARGPQRGGPDGQARGDRERRIGDRGGDREPGAGRPDGERRRGGEGEDGAPRERRERPAPE